MLALLVAHCGRFRFAAKHQQESHQPSPTSDDDNNGHHTIGRTQDAPSTYVNICQYMSIEREGNFDRDEMK